MYLMQAELACEGSKTLHLLPVQNLRRKAEQRNPDEFYFAMERRRTSGGVVAGRSADFALIYSQMVFMSKCLTLSSSAGVQHN